MVHLYDIELKNRINRIAMLDAIILCCSGFMILYPHRNVVFMTDRLKKFTHTFCLPNRQDSFGKYLFAIYG